MTTGSADTGDAVALEVARFVERVRALTDDERAAVAEARGAIDETFHEKAFSAGVEALAGRGELYARARRELARAHIPDRLLDSDEATADEIVRWANVSRLVQVAIDEMLLAVVGSDTLHPNHLRELSRPWGPHGRLSRP